MKLFVINGPNLNMLGIREPDVYGAQTYDQLVAFIQDVAKRECVDVSVYQSNHEGEIVDLIQSAYGVAEGIIINPAAYTHTSIAILDALKAVALPAVEVHLSDVRKREAFRQISYAGQACIQTFMGHGWRGYEEALLWLKAYLLETKER